jgi:translation initiation factor IF-2
VFEPEIEAAPSEGVVEDEAVVAEIQPAVMGEAVPPEPAVEEAPPEQVSEPVMPAGPQNVPAPAKLQGPRVVRVEAPEHVSAPPRSAGPRRPAAFRPEPETEPAREGAPSRGRRGADVAAEDAKKRKGRLNPRRSRSETDVVATERLREWREQDLIERQERMNSAVGRGLHSRRAREARSAGGGHRTATAIRTTAQVTLPIIMHEYCAATGIGMNQLMPTLIRDHNIMPNRNTVLEESLAAQLAAEHGIALEIVRPKSMLEHISDEFAVRERAHLASRPPVVTFLGHVDHGKTSLLDAIRKTRVAAGEAGGITQHIGAYRIDRNGRSVTFLDTPGHEAFTSMRARGAHLTDVVVLVVAADDGVMPQTVEAINHAKAAGVPVVVALNKTDLPGVDVNKILGQLSERQLVPSEWGGDVDVIRTSAKTGAGIDALLEHLSTLSELLELKADPTLPANGTVIEAKVRPGVGTAATVLVQEGTMRMGDVVVCGPAFGRVRALVNDQGERVEEAPPATPVELVGLDEVPSAGDRFFVLDSLNRAKEAAEEVRENRRRDSLFKLQKPRSLEEIFSSQEEGETPELNLILRADVQGSVDVLTSTLGGIATDEVRVRILQAAVGPITEGDVILAEASDAIVIGFHVVAETGAQRLAEEKGVDIRLYRVIYDISNDIRRALEGMLEPDRKEETSGRVEVRNTFSVSKVGTIAGCYVVDGVVRRTDYVRLVREGRIIIPSEDDVERGRHRGIHSLKRFKDDAKEVRAGLECGIKIEDYDDVKVGDMIESYSVIEVSRKLS